jgi:hypothetical protein
MACIPQISLSGINFDCAQTTGGIKRLFIGYKQGDGAAIGGVDEITGLTYQTDLTAADFGQITSSTPASTYPVFAEVKFNKKDGVSVFTDVLTTEENGTKNTIPTIMVEIPLMNAENMTALSYIASNDELVALIETAANTWHMVGKDFGLRAATIDGTSGTGRSEKNRYQLTLQGTEGSLAYQFTSVGDFEDVAAL